MSKSKLFTLIGLFFVMSCNTAGEKGPSDNINKDKPVSNASSKVNLKEWAAASKILHRAAELIIEKGWQQGAVDHVEAHCAATAMEAAFHEGKYTIVDFNYAREAISRVIKVDREPAKLANDELAVPYWGRTLMEWNDARGRTKDEVIKAFEEASQMSNKLSLQ